MLLDHLKLMCIVSQYCSLKEYFYHNVVYSVHFKPGASLSTWVVLHGANSLVVSIELRALRGCCDLMNISIAMA